MKTSEAIASLKTLCNTCTMFPKCVNNKPECFRAIEMAISALKNRERERWHSVAKEGNPKESGFYLWTSKDGTVREDYYQVRDDTWSKAWQFGYKVIAWKNEPESYTEEEA